MEVGGGVVVSEVAAAVVAGCPVVVIGKAAVVVSAGEPVVGARVVVV